eukprot:2772332-Pleurochrysis_carterae.AAC.4
MDALRAHARCCESRMLARRSALPLVTSQDVRLSLSHEADVSEAERHACFSDQNPVAVAPGQYRDLGHASR